MSLREKLAQRAAPFLEPGETVQSIFVAQTGPSPYFFLLSIWIVVFGSHYYTIVATDRAMLVLRNGKFASANNPKKVHLRGPRNVWLGTPSGIWGKIQLDQRYWVHKRFHKDVIAADDALRAMNPAA
jgi:hypothetical protein